MRASVNFTNMHLFNLLHLREWRSLVYFFFFVDFDDFFLTSLFQNRLITGQNASLILKPIPQVMSMLPPSLFMELMSNFHNFAIQIISHLHPSH
jgi:hypothetical protein